MTTVELGGYASFNGSGLVHAELSITYAMVELTSALPHLDPSWRYTDRAGHKHAYSLGTAEDFPTLLEIIHVCADHGADETCEACATEFQCRICNERIVPGTTVDTTKRYGQGRMDWSVELENLGPQPEVGTMGVVWFGNRFGVAVVSSVKSGSFGNRVTLTGAGVLGEVRE